MKSRYSSSDLLSCLFLLLLAALPRLANLLALDPFVDEVNYVHWAVDRFRPDRPATYWLTLSADGRPPLYFWLLIALHWVSENAFVSARLVSAIASIGSTLVLYALGAALLSRQVGVVAGVLWALAPLGVFFGRIAADDALLTFWSLLGALLGVRVVHSPSLLGGAMCGVAIGLAILTKTLGLLTLATPVLAAITLVSPSCLARRVGPLLVTVSVAALISSPLLPWLPNLYRKAAFHAYLDLAGPGAGDGAWALLGSLSIGRFTQNFGNAASWYVAYLGLPMIALAIVGLLLGLARRDRGVVCVAALLCIPGLVLLERTQTLYSRYLLPLSFPLYLLAGTGMVAVAALAPRVRGAIRREWGASGRAAFLVCALVLTLAPVLPFTAHLVMAPERAPLPPLDREMHVEHWYALYGLRDVVSFLRAEAGPDRATVLVPPTSSEGRVLLPHQALRLYARDDPHIAFTEVRDLFRADNLRRLHGWAESQAPTFLVVNGTHTESWGASSDAPDYTRRIEAAIARDVPEARIVLHIPRPAGPSWLSVYRLDRAREGSYASPARSSLTRPPVRSPPFGRGSRV